MAKCGQLIEIKLSNDNVISKTDETFMLYNPDQKALYMVNDFEINFYLPSP